MYALLFLDRQFLKEITFLGQADYLIRGINLKLSRLGNTNPDFSVMF